MSNQLSMAQTQAIQALAATGQSYRAISRALGVDRGTVAKTLSQIQNQPPVWQAPTGSDDAMARSADAPTGVQEVEQAELDLVAESDAKTCLASNTPVAILAADDAEMPAASRSECEPYREQILRKLEQGLTAQRIWQDLNDDYGFSAKYHSVRRYVAKLQQKTPDLVRRMEVAAGAEAQIDFGTGAWITTTDAVTGKTSRRRSWVFRIVLSHSRKGYSEAVFHQSTEAFIGALENSFRYFGGVPKTLVIDNFKAAVKQADWYDPEIHPKLQSFAQHYGTVFLPTKPYTPEHKGKVESGVKYVKNNGLKGHTFVSLEAENKHLLEWEDRVADTRLHGTTKRQVRQHFEETERPSLLPLPVERFPFFHEGRRSVNRDGHVEVAKSYYSAPPEFVGRDIWVRWDSRLVRLFTDKWEQVAVHARAEPGKFRTDSNHIPKKRVSSIERGAKAMLNELAIVGKAVKDWSESMLQARGVEGIRVLQGLKALASKHDATALNTACETALSHGAMRLRTIRKLLQRQNEVPQQRQFDFLTEHPIIRPLTDYSIESLNQFRKDRH
jgi:transposase